MNLEGMKLGQLDSTIASRPHLDSNVAKRAKALAGVVLTDLSLGDMAFCLRQLIAVPHVLPLVLEALAKDPLLVAEHYPGDLLLSALAVEPTPDLTTANEIWDICCSAETAANRIISDVLPTVRRYLHKE
jgi:CDI immunity proteins